MLCPLDGVGFGGGAWEFEEGPVIVLFPFDVLFDEVGEEDEVEEGAFG